jgi:hypothetical protein
VIKKILLQFSKILSHLFRIQVLIWSLKNFRSASFSQKKRNVVFERGIGGINKRFLGLKWYGWKYYDVFYTMESSSTANTFSKPLKNCLEVKLSKSAGTLL